MLTLKVSSWRGPMQRAFWALVALAASAADVRSQHHRPHAVFQNRTLRRPPHRQLSKSDHTLNQFCTGVRRSRDVIVYLGQKTHSSYDATHKNTLNASMESLRHNMRHIAESDVIVWHEGDLTPRDANALDGSTNVRFCLLTKETGWGPPPWLAIVPESKFSAGYRFMIRFYAVTIWKTLHSLGYQWVMRMDDDSFVLSPVEYNIFDDMRQSGYLYAYRMLSRECPTIFGDFVESYVEKASDRPEADTETDGKHDEAVDSAALDEESKHIIKFCGTWPRHCRRASMRDALHKALQKAGLASPSESESSVAPDAKRTNMPKPRQSASWYCEGPGRLGYYNNWFVTSIDWWLRHPRTVRMIAAFDRSNLIFTRRCNDLIFQTAAIKLYMPKIKRKRYVDFTYQHHTVSNGLVTFGGIESGSADPNAMRNLQKYLEKHIPGKQRSQINIETCDVQSVVNGELVSISYISPASFRQRSEAETNTGNIVVNRFESPYCSPGSKTYLT